MSGGEKNLGRYSGFITVGEVVNVEDDPTQSGQARVKWLSGAAVADKVSDEDRPWHPSLFPTSNPSLGQTGGPHTGLRKGSRVIGIPLDGAGQDFLILGTIVKGGEGGSDGGAKIDSDIPQPAKIQQNGGEDQPRWGDRNSVVTDDSIVKYAENEGGREKKAARFATLTDPIGTLDNAIE